jgi:hypothetical protein
VLLCAAAQQQTHEAKRESEACVRSARRGKERETCKKKQEKEKNKGAGGRPSNEQAWEREEGCFGVREGAAAKQLFWHEMRGCFGA